jgi:glycosyltransferase involved in cell wall biosynthesis
MSNTLIYVIAITPNKFGGIERFTQELAVQMEEYGWKLVLCFETKPTEQVRRCYAASNVFFEALDNQSSADIRQYSKLVRLVVRYQPKVFVYAFNGVLRFMPWTVKLLGVGTIFYNDHSSRPYQHCPGAASWWKRALGRIITFPLDGVICVSNFVNRSARKEGWVRPDKIHTILNGVGIDAGQSNSSLRDQAIQFREKYSIAAERKIVLQVSWLVPEKGIDTFLNAAHIVIASEPLAHFVVVGTGRLFETYCAQASELGIQDNITWTGALEDPIQAGAYAAAHIACQLSTWQEAFGLTITEAMACGVPVVATRTGGIPEIVRDGANGFLVPVNDPESTSERILTLLRNDAMREKMGRTARIDVMRRFDVRDTARAYLQLLGIATK